MNVASVSSATTFELQDIITPSSTLSATQPELPSPVLMHPTSSVIDMTHVESSHGLAEKSNEDRTSIALSSSDGETLQELVTPKYRQKRIIVCSIFSICSINIITLVAFVLLGLILGLILYFFFLQNEAIVAQQELDRLVQIDISELNNILKINFKEVSVLQGIFFGLGHDTIPQNSIAYCATNCTMGRQTLSVEEFRTYIRNSEFNSKGIHSIRYAPVILQEERPAFENAVGRYVNSFSIFDADDMDTIRFVSPTRPIYYPILFSYPINVLGYNVGSNTNILAAIEEAIQTKNNTASRRVKLLTEQIANYYGFYTVFPVFNRTGNSNSVFVFEEDLNVPTGFAFGVFNYTELVLAAFERMVFESGVTVLLLDLNDPNTANTLLYSTNLQHFGWSKQQILNYYSSATVKSSTNFSVLNQNWTFLFVPQSNLSDFQIQSYKIISLTVSLAASLFLALLLLCVLDILIYSIIISCVARERTNLLHKIIPKKIANRIRAGEYLCAEKISNVSVLFADLVGFTSMSTKLKANDLVSLLNSIYSKFDVELASLDLEKIKTIGDCYMAISGFEDSGSHVKQAVLLGVFAFKLITIMKDMNSKLHLRDCPLNLRIGISYGEVIAGIIGKEKPLYDIWGDTVNTASRMESNSSVGKIHVSKEYLDIVKPYFSYESRGEQEIKGKGKMETFFLLRPLDTAINASFGTEFRNDHTSSKWYCS